MPRRGLIIPHDSDGTLPDLACYHVTSRVVHRQFLFQAEEKEHFRLLMRMYERFTRWFNKQHGLRGHLWEDRFHSVIVESGLAARTMAAYIDLNPVRGGIVEDSADYRWSSCGEAVGRRPAFSRGSEA